MSLYTTNTFLCGHMHQTYQTLLVLQNLHIEVRPSLSVAGMLYWPTQPRYLLWIPLAVAAGYSGDRSSGLGEWRVVGCGSRWSSDCSGGEFSPETFGELYAECDYQ